MAPVPSEEVFLSLLKSAMLPDEQVAPLLDQACDPGYWRGLTSGLTVLDTAPAIAASTLGDKDLTSAVESLRDEGLFHLPPVLTAASLHAMNVAIDAVVRAGWPAVCVFLYDQPWLCARLPPVQQLLEKAVGEPCLQIPNVWTHVVRPVRGAAGWFPHVDALTPRRVTVWLALTPATLSNGCMYAVPRTSVLPAVAARWKDIDERTLLPSMNAFETLTLMHGARAMPAEAGEALGWHSDILHWGGHSAADGPERRAFSLEFIAASQPNSDGDDAALPTSGELPSWTARLRMVAGAISSYSRFELSVIRFRPFARQLLHRLA